MIPSIARTFLAIALLGGLAHADVSAAARAFSDGQSAQLAGDYDHAAQSFELAYTILPSEEALRSAIRARQMANQLPRAGMLAEMLAASYAGNPTSAQLAAEVLAEAKLKLGRISIRCSTPCSIAINQRSVSLVAGLQHVVYANPGGLRLEASFGPGALVQRDVTVGAGEGTTLDLAAPAAPPPGEPKVVAPRPSEQQPVARTSGLSPYVLVAGGLITAGLTGATVWSGLDTNKAHDAYVANPNHDAFTAGRSKQLRTNLLLGGSIAAGVATIAVGVFFTNWSGEGKRSSAVGVLPSASGVSLAYGGQF